MVARQPKGTPIGGQFAEQRRAGAQVALLDEPGGRWLPDDFEINEDFPLPQANDLDKVALVVRAVRGEAATASAIAQALDVTDREGAYYAAAAGYLGLVERGTDDELGSVFFTTSAGNLLDEVDETDRAAIMAEVVSHAPGVQAYREDGEVGIAELYAFTGEVNETTADRRIATIRSWVRQVDDVDGLAQACQRTAADRADAIQTAAAACIAEARARREQRERELEAAKPKICMTHFVQLPATGVCDQCAEAAA